MVPLFIFISVGCIIIWVVVVAITVFFRLINTTGVNVDVIFSGVVLILIYASIYTGILTPTLGGFESIFIIWDIVVSFMREIQSLVVPAVQRKGLVVALLLLVLSLLLGH